MPAAAAASVGASPTAPTMAAMTASASGQRRDGGERIGPAGDARRQPRCRDALREARGRGAIGERRNGGAMTLDLREQRFVIRVRGERDDAEPIRVAAGDVERRLADRARRAEDREALHATIPSQPKPSASSGTDDVRLSMRSSMPPWPGSRLPLSLSPCWRLNMLSSRSPTTDTSTAATHSERKAGRRQAEPGLARERDDEAGDEPAEHAFPGLVRAHDRREPQAAEPPAGEVRADVGGPGEQHDEHDELAPVAVLQVEARQREPGRRERPQARDRREPVGAKARRERRSTQRAGSSRAW